jgi:hypothetical protein
MSFVSQEERKPLDPNTGIVCLSDAENIQVCETKKVQQGNDASRKLLLL